MDMRLFFKKWFSNDEKLTFFALIFTALTTSVEILHPDKVNVYKDFAESIQLSEYDTAIFKERISEYNIAILKDDIHLNDLIAKISKTARIHPEWISEVPLEALMLCISKDEIVQKRVLEFILRLLQECPH